MKGQHKITILQYNTRRSLEAISGTWITEEQPGPKALAWHTRTGKKKKVTHFMMETELLVQYQAVRRKQREEE
jgi:hypothetical protein